MILKFLNNIDNTTKMQTVKITVCKLNQCNLILDYSHSIVPTGFGVRSKRTRLMPSTSAVMRFVIL